jgi:hypothetical protein
LVIRIFSDSVSDIPLSFFLSVSCVLYRIVQF